MLLLPDDAWEMRGRAFSSHDAEKQNRGIFATRPIRAGTVIGDYLGLLIPNEQEAEYETGQDVYLMATTTGSRSGRTRRSRASTSSITPASRTSGSRPIGATASTSRCGGSTPARSCWSRTCWGRSTTSARRAATPAGAGRARAPAPCTCRSIGTPPGAASTSARRSGRKADPVEAYQALRPLDRYPARIPDRGFHAIYGSAERPPKVMRDEWLPGVASLRREIRRTGRRLAYPALGLTVLGVDGTTLVLESVTSPQAPSPAP